jgi:hypothetical protein
MHRVSASRQLRSTALGPPGSSFWPCAREFDRRLSSLADILKRFDIVDSSFPPGVELAVKSHTLGRIEMLFRDRLTEDELPFGARGASHALRAPVRFSCGNLPSRNPSPGAGRSTVGRSR